MGAKIVGNGWNGRLHTVAARNVRCAAEGMYGHFLAEQFTDRPGVLQDHHFDRKTSAMQAVGEVACNSINSARAKMVEQDRNVR